jgi:hypothetical protein
MGVYKVGLPEAVGYELCHPVEGDLPQFIYRINGMPLRTKWHPIEVRIVHEEYDGTHLEESDAPWLGSEALIFRPRAIEALEPLLSQDGELLPLPCAEADLHVYNPRVVDALDESASQVARLKSGRIMVIERHVFRPARLEGIHFFKIPNLPVSATFVSEEVVRRWRDAALRGLAFTDLTAPPSPGGDA